MRMKPLIATVITLSLPTNALAGGIWLYDMGAPSMGRAGAGSGASAEDAATAFSNPAGMSLLEETELLVGAAGMFISTEFQPGPENEVPGGNGGDAGGFTPGGGLYYAKKYSDKTSFGLTVNSWFGLGLDYDDDWTGRYFAQEADLFTAAVTGTVSRRLNDRWSIGGGVSLLYGELTVETAINNALDGLEDGKIDINSDDTGFGFNAGLMYELSPDTRFGLTYRSEVELDLDDAVRAEGVGPTLEAVLGQLGLGAGTKVNLDVVVPQGAALAGWHRVSDRLSIMGDIRWQDWSEFGSIGVSLSSEQPSGLVLPERYNDTWRVGVGAEWDVEGNPFTISAGASYDSSPVDNNERTPEFPLDRQIRLSVGLHKHRADRFDWSITYTYVDSGTGKIDNALGPLTGRLQGDYDPYHVHTLGFHISM